MGSDVVVEAVGTAEVMVGVVEVAVAVDQEGHIMRRLHREAIGDAASGHQEVVVGEEGMMVPEVMGTAAAGVDEEEAGVDDLTRSLIVYPLLPLVF
jgi:hypothetical protein